MTVRGSIRAVVFDMDGVLIDSHPMHRAAWREFLQSMHIDASDRELEFILEGRTRNEILRHFLGELPDDELQLHGRRKDEIFRAMEYEIQPVAGALEFLAKLEEAGIAGAVATSASEIRTFATLERMGLGGYFDAVITSADVTAGKPDPMVYQFACERIGVAGEDALAFDDAHAGVQAARSAGMRCIGVASNGLSATLLEAGAEAIIPDFRGLEVPWLESLVCGTAEASARTAKDSLASRLTKSA
ncbi:MAG TPA: HAD family phosphatase [Terriglobales bacterium]